jgi:hypothetical protein
VWGSPEIIVIWTAAKIFAGADSEGREPEDAIAISLHEGRAFERSSLRQRTARSLPQLELVGRSLTC